MCIQYIHTYIWVSYIYIYMHDATPYIYNTWMMNVYHVCIMYEYVQVEWYRIAFVLRFLMGQVDCEIHARNKYRTQARKSRHVERQYSYFWQNWVFAFSMELYLFMAVLVWNWTRAKLLTPYWVISTCFPYLTKKTT